MDPSQSDREHHLLRARGVGAILLVGALIWVAAGASAQTPPPVACEGAEIHWLNPDSETGTGIVSAYSLNGPVGYRLVAWVLNAPDDVQVDFDADTQGGQYYDYSFNQVTSPPAHVDVATDVPASGQAYEAQWLTSAMGYTYGHGEQWTLTATLSVGGATCDQDTEVQAVNDNNNQYGVGEQGMVLTAPTLEGQIGFLVGPDGSTAAPVTTAQAMGYMPGYAQTELWYSKSVVGSEPAWQSCGVFNPSYTGGTTQTFSCTLVGSDVASDVTAIAASSLSGVSLGGSDANPVAPYVITPTTLTLKFLDGDPTGPPNVLSQVEFNQCTDVLQVQVEDQMGQPIPHVNVDIHAVGPTDKLRFGSSFATDAFNAPDLGDHGTENSANCPNDSDGDVVLQGDHDAVGEADIKHVESTGNTDLSGDFTWMMFLPGSSSGGDTQIEVWVDMDDNDTHCAAELSADAAIAWGQGNQVTSAGLLPQQDACPVVLPTPQPTPTPSPTPTPTPTPTPSTSPTASPTPSATPPAPTPAPEPTKAQVHSIVTIRKGFAGAIGASLDICDSRRTVVLKKKRPGPDRKVGSDVSSRSGTWSIKMTKSGSYYAVALKKTAGDGLGPPLVCLAAKTITLRLN